MKMTDKDIVNAIWHFKVDDNMSWEFCHGVLMQDGESITLEAMKAAFLNYFEEATGVAPYTKCPGCGELLLPRQSKYGYFVGCSAFPKCRFIATSKKRNTEGE